MAETPCQRCGSPLPPEARFCPRCGAPVARSLTQERKVVTVLFADVAGSTELAGRMDPERLREVMGAFFNSVSEELESLRGRAEKFVGDAVMALWGLPHAHDDDALRAVRAGFAIRDRTARLSGTLNLPVPLRVRVGVNSGPVATGSGPADQFLVSGTPVNMAARIQEAAEPDEILVGQTTWQLTRHAVEYGPPRRIEARGFGGEVRAYPALAISARSSRRTIPMVDRRRELALLVDTFGRAREASRTHLITVLGEPGIGKSRLVAEFVAGLDEDVKVLTGGANDFEEDVTFAPITEMVLRELAVERDTPSSVIRERLEDLVNGCCDPPESHRVVARLGLLLGIGEDPRDQDPERAWDERLARFEDYVDTEGRERHRYRAAEVRAGLEKLVEGMARRAPVVLVFEDLQMARDELLELIEELVRRNRRIPLFVLCVARDELLEHRPGWAGGIPDAVTLRLEPLATDEAVELALVAGESLDEFTADRIARQAGGNPFFVIETTGMLLQEHPEHRLGALHSHLLPPTVQAVVASRIDHLPDDARELLRKASVFARSTFSTWELSLIAEPDQRLLQVLQEEEFLVRDPERENVWNFRHDMLRDVAYESLAKRERLRLHLEVADGLEASPEADRYPQVVAYHLAQAAEASLDLDPADRSVADRAVKALARAGDQARRRMESATAVDLYERALRVAGPEEKWGRREARILSGIGESSYWMGEFDEARVALTRALEVAGPDAWTRTHALRFLADITLNVEGDPDRAADLFDEALAAARDLGDAFAMARTLLMAAWAPYWRADLDGARAMFEQALRIARSNPEGDPWAEARALVSLTSVVTAVGDEEESLELGREALRVGREMDDPFTIAVAEEAVANSLRRMLRLDEALPAIEDAIRSFRDLGARWELASALGDQGVILRLGGRPREAVALYQEAMEICRQLGERSLIQWTALELITVHLALGERKSAQRLVEDNAAWVEMSGDSGARMSRLLSESLIALAQGDRDRARDLSVQVLELERAEQVWQNSIASRTWWVGVLFGPEMVGGEQVLEDARTRLDSVHWLQALKEPELAAQLEPA